MTEITDTTATPAAETAPAPKVVAFASMAGRTKIVPLKYPVTCDGVLIEQIEIRRVTGAEIAAFVAAASEGRRMAYPGVNVPLEVYENLDADDTATFNRELNDFLPQGFAEAAPHPEI